MSKKTGTLYVVATPIGNLEDITLRALRILKEADFIACEDTRVTKKLLNKYEIKTSLISYHQHSKISKIDQIVEKLKEGSNGALVTDAGTPGISDPGNVLVDGCVQNDIRIEPIPGPSALTALASVSGINMQKFTFLAFSPKKGKAGFFGEVLKSEYPVVYYESPHRLIKNLEILKEIASESKKEPTIIIGRELTKIFEEVVRGSADKIIKYFSEKKIKGELVVIVY